MRGFIKPKNPNQYAAHRTNTRPHRISRTNRQSISFGIRRAHQTQHTNRQTRDKRKPPKLRCPTRRTTSLPHAARKSDFKKSA